MNVSIVMNWDATALVNLFTWISANQTKLTRLWEDVLDFQDMESIRQLFPK